jgi:hypothetical protein
VSANVVVAPGAFGGYGSGLLPSKLTPFASTELFLKGTEPRSTDSWYVQGCPKADGTATVGMRIREIGPAVWAGYTQRWIADAQKGVHSYGRYTWSLVTEDQCPSPSASPTPTPSLSGPPRSTTPRPTFTFVPFSLPPGITLPPGLTPSPPTPTPTPNPLPTPNPGRDRP